MAIPSEAGEQSRAMTRQAAHFVTEMERILSSMSLLLESPGRNDAHTYTEIVRLAAQVRGTAEVSIDNLAFVATQEPASVSLRRLSAAMGISVNTLRRKQRSLGTDQPDPFVEEGRES